MQEKELKPEQQVRASWRAGTKREKYLAENIAAFEISQKLTKEDLAEIEAAFPHAEIAGERYPEAHMKATYKHSERK